MIRVLCSGSELGEYGEVLQIGDHVRRLAARQEADIYYGTELDALDWRFDRYADAGGYESATISGIVVALQAVYVRLTRSSEGWTARVGSATQEPVLTTSATRKPLEVIDWQPPTPPDAAGRSFRHGHRRIEEGTEQLSGWLITLAESQIEIHIPGK